jgi:Mg2+ and Co2+ transporter CorA
VIVTESFEPKPGESWLWIAEQIELVGASEAQKRAAVLIDHHRPENYAGHPIPIGEQPVIMTAPDHDHLVLPDLDIDAAGNQLVSIIVQTHKIETRHAGAVALLGELRHDEVFKARAVIEKTSAFLFVSIMQLTLDQIDRKLSRAGDELDALEAYITTEKVDRELARLDLVRHRSAIARYRKLYDAFRRVTDTLFDPKHGAYGEGGSDPAHVIVRETQRHFSRLRDQIDRALGYAGQLQESIAALDELLRAQQAEDLNEVLLVLTVVSAGSLPFVVVSGFFGMNVQLPGKEQWDGLLWAVAAMLLLALPGWVWMARWINRKWSGRVSRQMPRTSKFLTIFKSRNL